MTKLLVAPWRTDRWVVLEGNPKGIVSSSPGLRACELPSDIVQTASQPQRGCGRARHPRTQPRWGWFVLTRWTQGSSLLANLINSLLCKPLAAWFALAPLSLCATVGPNYVPATNSVPATYKAAELGAWKEGKPLDNVPKGNWWEVFDDAALNELESQASNANQQLKAAI